ncbi:MAG TPA: phenylalanine--tRNA ligase subunit alpha [Candidatus Nanoarchaeia archaeon]|nr:phenylalanine--tRNA ligase subunit alpha [Candidatus Nanoarchaeia archaeon]
MDQTKISESLNPFERKVIREVENHSDFREIMNITGLLDVEVMRSLQWLTNKNLVTLSETQKELVSLDENGLKYLKTGLPEKILLESLQKPSKFSELEKKTGLTREEIQISIGTLKTKAAIDTKKEDELILSINDQGKNLLHKGFIEEQFLKGDFPKEISSLNEREKFALESLKKRKKIIKIEISKSFKAELTELGKKILAKGLDESIVEKLTSSMLKSGSWKGKKFRRYDVKINVPSEFPGRKQHYRRFLDEVRQKFIALGFKEMSGPIVETDFWDMDALFMPQFHSARDIHQGYYIKEPKLSKSLPEDVVKRVKATHENGFNTGSRGWRYNFDEKRTRRYIMRTHDTSISARTLASKDLKIPGKYFQIGRCFRYDVIDATHLPDFNQVGGFVIEEGINFGHLKSLLRMFAKEFAGSEEIKITPSYFPFTEPSAQLMVKHPELGWMELGGSGIFRPELVKPLVGKEMSVIAWGVGLDRLAMFKLGINDIRHLFSHDLEFLRNAKTV